jgi:hypothetical protein
MAQTVCALSGNTNALFPMVALHLSMPAVLLIVFGALLWDGVGWHRRPALVSVEDTAFQNVMTDFINPRKDLVRVVASAAGFAAVATHSLCVIPVLSLCRVGLFRV